MTMRSNRKTAAAAAGDVDRSARQHEIAEFAVPVENEAAKSQRTDHGAPGDAGRVGHDVGGDFTGVGDPCRRRRSIGGRSGAPSRRSPAQDLKDQQHDDGYRSARGQSPPTECDRMPCATRLRKIMGLTKNQASPPRGRARRRRFQEGW